MTAASHVPQVNLDAPRPGEVLVRISAVGICHTDLATRDGALPFPLPGVLGHEGAGVVVEVGEGVTKVAPGDRVGVSFASCGSCPACASGAPAYCHRFMEKNYAGGRTSDGSSALSTAQGPVGSSFFGQSSFATHAITGERNVVKVGSDIPPHLVAPLGCGVQTGAGAIMRSFAAPAGSSVLILGGGSVGLSAVLGAVVQGCGHIIVVEPVAARRELAARLGATHTIDPAAGAVSEQVRGLLPGGVNFALDTTGHAGVLAEAVQCPGNQGTLGMLGVPSDPGAVLSLSLIQSLAGSIASRVSSRAAIRMRRPRMTRATESATDSSSGFCTKAPPARPVLMRIRPCTSRMRSASRTVARLMWVCVTRSRSVGSAVPSGNSPRRTRSRRSSARTSEALGTGIGVSRTGGRFGPPFEAGGSCISLISMTGPFADKKYSWIPTLAKKVIPF